MANHITSDHDLIEVVSSAAEEDLSVLADFITDNNNGRIALNSVIRGQLDTFKRNGTLHKNSDLIIKEIQEFGGNSMANFYRRLFPGGNGIPYREIVEDVADHDLRAFGHEGPRMGRTHAPGAAGDDRNFVLYSSHGEQQYRLNAEIRTSSSHLRRRVIY